MHRAISDYKITKRKDGRYYVRLQDGGDITHIYGKTKAEIQAKLEIKLEELSTLSRRRTEQAYSGRRNAASFTQKTTLCFQAATTPHWAMPPYTECTTSS